MTLSGGKNVAVKMKSDLSFRDVLNFSYNCVQDSISAISGFKIQDMHYILLHSTTLSENITAVYP
jgi:hypothetical protein